MQGQRQMNGIDLKKEENGIGNMEKKHGKIEKKKNIFAVIVKKFLKLSMFTQKKKIVFDNNGI